MLNPLSRLLRRWPRRTPYGSLSVGWLWFFFLGAGLPALYAGTVISRVAPPLIEATNRVGLTMQAFGLWLVVGVLGAATLYFGAVARRCGGLLYDRHFR